MIGWLDFWLFLQSISSLMDEKPDFYNIFSCLSAFLSILSAIPSCGFGKISFLRFSVQAKIHGGVSEWLKVTVLKTVVG